MDHLNLSRDLGLEPVSCGLFISSGKGSHPDRILDNYELIVVRQGTLSILEEDVRFDIAKGQFVLLFPGRRHRGAAPFSRNLSFYWVHFKLTDNLAGSSQIRVPKFGRVHRIDCVSELFHRYLDDQEAKRLDDFYAALLILQLLCEVSRKSSPPASGRGLALVGRTDAYLTCHLAEKLSTSRIAQALRINPDYLNRTFREVHGMTLTEYIHRRKLRDAACLLRDTTKTVAEIATECGYASASYLARVFERYQGVKPSAYRQLTARAFVNTR